MWYFVRKIHSFLVQEEHVNIPFTTYMGVGVPHNWLKAPSTIKTWTTKITPQIFKPYKYLGGRNLIQ